MSASRTAALAVVLAAAPASAGSGRDAAERLAGRTFPSVFQAWNRADNLPDEERLATAARHDLIFHGVGFFGLRWADREHRGRATAFRPDSIAAARKRRAELLERNPNLVLLAEIRYRDAHRSWLPAGHAWWLRDADGKIVAGWKEGGYWRLDFGNAAYRRHVAARAKAAVGSGVLDGVMLDWWRDDADRLALLGAVREAVGPDALILVNSNDRRVPRSAKAVNGLFMECTRTREARDWQRLAGTLAWAEKALRTPRINCLETWYHRSREDLHLMRATTTLALTRSDGFCLFSDPNPLPKPDHLHNWYPFWDAPLGRPKAPGREHHDGTWRREFTGGLAVYNPIGNTPATLAFDRPRTSRATGRTARKHTVQPCDGDVFLSAREGRRFDNTPMPATDRRSPLAAAVGFRSGRHFRFPDRRPSCRPPSLDGHF